MGESKIKLYTDINVNKLPAKRNPTWLKCREANFWLTQMVENSAFIQADVWASCTISPSSMDFRWTDVRMDMRITWLLY